MPARAGKKMWDLGQIKDKFGLVGWGWHGVGQEVMGGICPHPTHPTMRSGDRTTHIVSVIVLIVGQLHHAVGALKGVQPWGPVRDNPKIHPTAPNQALGPSANPAGITEPVGSAGGSGMQGLASQRRQSKCSNAHILWEGEEGGILIIILKNIYNSIGTTQGDGRRTEETAEPPL